MISKLSMLRKDEKGFTLVEILVVIIIIGIIAAIAIPAFLNQRKRANDATLISDTKNVAQELTAWFGDGQRTASDLSAITGKPGTEIALGVFGKGRPIADPTVDWNHYPALPRLNASPGNLITISVNQVNNGYNTKHESGDFCVSSHNDNSTHNYSTPGVTGAGNYDKVVYYDVQLGGITDMERMVKAVQAKEPLSCGHFAKRYMLAKGIPIPS